MSMTIVPPSDEQVRESVERVQRSLFTGALRGSSHHRRRILAGAGAFMTAALLVAGGGAIAGVWELPGEPHNTVLNEWSTVSGTGASELDLGTAPDGANWIALRWSCVGIGEVVYSMGGDTAVGSECRADDLSLTSSSSPTFPLESGRPTLHIDAADGVKWTAEYRFIDRQYSEWATNANGETFGVSNEKGSPDLVAVSTPDGRIAYVRSSDMFYVPDPLPDIATQDEIDAWNSEHANDVISVPAYESDGTTVIGEWITGGDNPGLNLSAGEAN